MKSAEEIGPAYENVKRQLEEHQVEFTYCYDSEGINCFEVTPMVGIRVKVLILSW